jgi:hypothetical protein
MGGVKIDEKSVAEHLADLPALTLEDVNERVIALSDAMRVDVRPKSDLERRLIDCILAGLRLLLPLSVLVVSFV